MEEEQNLCMLYKKLEAGVTVNLEEEVYDLHNQHALSKCFSVRKRNIKPSHGVIEHRGALLYRQPRRTALPIACRRSQYRPNLSSVGSVGRIDGRNRYRLCSEPTVTVGTDQMARMKTKLGGSSGGANVRFGEEDEIGMGFDLGFDKY